MGIQYLFGGDGQIGKSMGKDTYKIHFISGWIELGCTNQRIQPAVGWLLELSSFEWWCMTQRTKEPGFSTKPNGMVQNWPPKMTCTSSMETGPLKWPVSSSSLMKALKSTQVCIGVQESCSALLIHVAQVPDEGLLLFYRQTNYIILSCFWNIHHQLRAATMQYTSSQLKILTVPVSPIPKMTEEERKKTQ